MLKIKIYVYLLFLKLFKGVFIFFDLEKFPRTLKCPKFEILCCFSHFFDKRPPWNGDQYHSSSFFSIIEPNLKLLGVTKLYRIKANLNPRTVFHRKGGWHIDFVNDPPFKTAVYYVNTNNGWTEFKNGGRVKSVANRMVIFDSNLEHQGVTCTDEKRRVVINFNYDV